MLVTEVVILSESSISFITFCKGKGKVVPVLNKAPRHEVYWGSGGVAPGILDLGTR
jgi:hypothetical protein